MSAQKAPKSDKRCATVRAAIEKFGGSREQTLIELFGGSCSRETALQYAVATAHCYGVTVAEFMIAYRKWRRHETFTLPTPADTQNQPLH